MHKKNNTLKKFIAVVEEGEKERMNTIAKQLKQNGATINQVLSFTGIITGTSNDLEKLNKVNGIQSVEEDRENFAF